MIAMGATSFKSFADAATAFDSLTARTDDMSGKLDLLAKDVRFSRARDDLAAPLAAMLATYGVTLPPVDEATGMIDEVALDAAMNTHPVNHQQRIVPPERQARLRRMLSDMGRL
jgi:hypothetical protein